MFTIYHFVWLAIIACLTIFLTVYLRKHIPCIDKVLNWCVGVCIGSELIKVFSTLEMIPSSDGSKLYPYLQLQHLPFHLCSIQIIIIFLARYTKNKELKNNLLAFIYPTGVGGAIAALLIPSIFSTSISVTQAFTHPLAYQFFLFHGMLLVLGLYIPVSDSVTIGKKQFKFTFLLLFGLFFISIYLNSMFAQPVYDNGVLVSVEYTTNFFFTYKPPVNINITTKGQWFLYLGVIIFLGFSIVYGCYFPFLKKEKNKK